MFLEKPRAASVLTCIAIVTILISSGGCASKRFVPRILSESVVVRDAPKSGDSQVTAAPAAGQGVRVVPTPPASKITSGKVQRRGRSAVGTMGIGEIGWAEALSLLEQPSEPAPAAQSPAKAMQSEPLPAPIAMLASMGDGGWFLVIAAIGCAMGAFIYRYRVY